MSFRVMLRALFILACFGGLVGVALCQSEAAGVEAAQGCLAEKSGAFVLDNGWGEEGTLLVGNIAGLASHIGDKLSVTGREYALRKGSGPHQALAVSSYRTILKHRPDGVQPQIGDRRNWSSFRSAKYGVGMRNPSKWAAQVGDHVEVGSNFVNDDGIEFLYSGTVPEDTYPGSNYVGGQFALIVNTKIENTGTCRQFGMTDDPVTTLRTVSGISFTEADASWVGMGTSHITYSVHTFQNGYCYEFVLGFDEEDGTGMDDACSNQWLTSANEQRLLKSLISQVSFSAPRVKNAVQRSSDLRPKATSLRISPSNSPVGTEIDVSWSTEGADYVQLRYPCTRRLDVSGMGGILNPEIKCGPVTEANYPANGSGKILLLNGNAGTVPFVLTVVPFQDGVAYDKGAKTVTVDVPPDRR